MNLRYLSSHAPAYRIFLPRLFRALNNLVSARAFISAPFERIKAQMANEAPLVSELIAWEWHSCLSPFGKDNTTTVVYQQYLAYIRGQ